MRMNNALSIRGKSVWLDMQKYLDYIDRRLEGNCTEWNSIASFNIFRSHFTPANPVINSGRVGAGEAKPLLKCTTYDIYLYNYVYTVYIVL